MKKLIIFALALAMVQAASAKKMYAFGLRGGANLTNMSFNTNPLTKENQTGFFVGPTFKLSVPIIGLAADISALYDQRGGKMAATEGDEIDITQKSLVIPLNLRYDFSLMSTLGVFLKAGPQIAFNVGDKDFKWNNGSSYGMSKSNFSINVGFGAMVLDHLEISANYNIACGNTGDGVWKNIQGAAENTFTHKNNSWQLGLAYYF